ncbi:hypothetical protein QJS10_CPB04g00429 [Acorus calamus]|uniref:3-isopropylmalate dehydratase n=1 Tax=Acorus calamus TaxID=4465 RepID=A0AAV9EZ57_ACOCL|nr:hypothetical protein QJS10_CPB04g00429 [Acorus calamus]
MAAAAAIHLDFSVAQSAATIRGGASLAPSKTSKTFSPISQRRLPFAAPKTLKFSTSSSKPLKSCPRLPISVSASASAAPKTTTFHGPCYVVGDNIDTDQIIPAEHLTLVPSKPEEYRKLGSFAMIGLPSAAYPIPFVEPGTDSTVHKVIIAGYNFGCGSSREHAPVALGAAGAVAVVAESYARIFFRNSVATGEVYPVESESRICDECTTGDIVTVDLEECLLQNHSTGKEYRLKPIGDAGPVIEAGGIFAYARKTGMIASSPI